MKPPPPPEWEGEELDFRKQEAEESEGSSGETRQLGGRSPYEGIIPSPSEEDKRLSPTTERRQMWPRGAEFLAASWAFTLSLHSLWTLPVVILQHGGLPFLVMYLVLLLLLGLPLLLLETFLGQYAALPPGRLYRHLSPALRGLGTAVCLQASLRAILDTAVTVWAGRGAVRLLLAQAVSPEFLSLRPVGLELPQGTGPGAWGLEVGPPEWEQAAALAAVVLVLLLLSIPGTLLMGKVSVLLVPTAYSLLLALGIRASLSGPGPAAVAALLWGPAGPDWSTLARGDLWLQAAAQVLFSLQLGLGGLTAYSSSNRYYHNLVRDCVVIAAGHLVWVLLTTYLVFAMLGLAHGCEAPVCDAAALRGLGPQLYNVTGEGVWLGLGTFMEESFPKLNFSWLWAALFLILVIITGLTSVIGFIKVVSSSLACAKPSCLPLRPLTVLGLLTALFLLCLPFTTTHGPLLLHLLSGPAAWPPLLFALLTILSSYCHGTNYLLKDLCGMSRVRLSHWLASHLSVLLYTVAPALITGALCITLYSLHLSSLPHLPPLGKFGMSLPEGWGVPLTWALAALSLLPLLLGLLLHVILSGGQSRLKHLRNSLIPTARWYKNEQLDLTGASPPYSSSV